MDSHAMSVWWWTECVLLFFLLSVPNIAHFIGAQSYDYPTANVSTTWIINSTDDFKYSVDGSGMSEILFREDYDQQFTCGFFCNSTSCDSFLFAILIAASIRTSEGPQPQVVWSANRNHPVRMKATLQLTSDGGLVLKDADGSIAWSTNTSGRSVAGLNLTDGGNLVLFDDYNTIVWQSIDHPTDCLVRGQTLRAGQKLIPSVSLANWTQLGFFSLSVTDRGFFASIESNPPQVYYQLLGYGMDKKQAFVRFLNGSFALFFNSSVSSEPYNRVSIPEASSAQYMRFGSDRHLRVYEWIAQGWTEVADLLTGYYGECSYPTVCGNYGICSNGQCSCPPPNTDGTNYFELVNYRQPNLGCKAITPLSCEVSKYHGFLELKDTSYFTFFFTFLNSTWEGCKMNATPESCRVNVTLESCKVSCLKNCSCKAVIFQYGPDRAIGNCYMPSQIFSLMNNDKTDFVYNSTVYLKVQNITNRHNISTAVPQRKKKSQMPKILGSSIGSLVGLLGILVLLLWKKGTADDTEDDFLDQVPGMLTRFSYEDLKAMTGNFSKVLGEGGFGSVFEGALVDGTKIAVKQLDGLGPVKKSFLTEAEAIGSIHHVNLVRLLGFCSDKSHRLLVYEYMSKGSLDRWIFHKAHDEFVLSWQQRKKIIIDIAKGLTYLHEDCRQKIIHLDIKPQNILLDDNFNAKISDFGLSKLIDRGQSKVVTTMRGTPGYLAPEWLSSVITEKVDVYSFGVVILEILCGRRNFDQSQPEERKHLLSLFQRKAEENQLLDLVDGHSEDMKFHGTEIMNIMKVAASCLQSDYAKRPSMSVVVNVLEGVTEVENSLDYNLSNRTAEKRSVEVEVTPLLPCILSGSR